MGLFASLKRKYNNAGAQVHLTAVILDGSKDCELRLLADIRCTGLDVHNRGRNALMRAIRVAQATPEVAAFYSLPADYWKIACAYFANTALKPEGRKVEYLDESVCMVANELVKDFFDGDEVFVAIDPRTREVQVSTVNMRVPQAAFRQFGPLSYAAALRA